MALIFGQMIEWPPFVHAQEERMIEDGGITKAEFEERINNCLTEMEKNNIDLLYVYGDSANPGNLIYLTNYRPIGTDLPGNCGYNAVFLLERDGEATLILDREWYLAWAKEESWVGTILADPHGDTVGLSFDFLKKKKLLKERMEADTLSMPVDVYKRFKKRFRGCKMDEESRMVSKLREIKSKKEIDLLSRGLEILGKAQNAGFSTVKEGVREIDIALEIRRIIMEEGGDFARALFIDAGLRSTIALASPMATNYRLKMGDMVLVSTFCTYKKYTAGLDRNWVVGEASEDQRKLAEIELKTLKRSISLVRPGIKACDFIEPVYTDFAEPLLKKAGMTDYNIQGYIGHGSGIQSKESPMLWKMDSTVLRSGMVIHIEPGIYSKDPKIGGIRTADTIVVTESGCKNITRYPRRIGTLT
jgi:Xaa-Pro aminopeptidase